MGAHLFRKLWILLPLSLLAASLWPAPALAHSHHHACVRRILLLRYDPNGAAEVAFTLGQDEFEQGEALVTDHGHMHWWANTCRWRIVTERTAWTQTQGDGFPGDVSDIHLQLRYGSAADAWRNITTDPLIWINGSQSGLGVYNGVDWRLIDVGEDAPSPFGPPPPGLYSCTVTFTIEYRS